MIYKFERSADCDSDLELIFDHLFETYLQAGESQSEAFERAAARLDSIQTAMEKLSASPQQGTQHPDWRPHLRHVTKDRAIFYFEVFNDTKTLRVLAVFFGGQDHVRHMLTRLGRSVDDKA